MRLRGKFIGGVLGACFGGPIGVALGVAIGHVCDSVSDSSESSLAARSKFLELACEGISKIAKADGRVSEGEIAEIEKIFAEMPKGNALALRKRRIGRSRHFSFPVRDNKNAGKPRSKNSPQYEACAHLGLGKRRLTALRKTRLRPRELRVLRPCGRADFSAAP